MAEACYLQNGEPYCIYAITMAPMFECIDGFVNFDESGEDSESEKGVVNSGLCEFHVCWVHIGAN